MGLKEMKYKLKELLWELQFDMTKNRYDWLTSSCTQSSGTTLLSSCTPCSGTTLLSSCTPSSGTTLLSHWWGKRTTREGGERGERKEENIMAGFNYKNINHKRSGQDDMVLLSQVKYSTMLWNQEFLSKYVQ